MRVCSERLPSPHHGAGFPGAYRTLLEGFYTGSVAPARSIGDLTRQQRRWAAWKGCFGSKQRVIPRTTLIPDAVIPLRNDGVGALRNGEASAPGHDIRELD